MVRIWTAGTVEEEDSAKMCIRDRRTVWKILLLLVCITWASCIRRISWLSRETRMLSHLDVWSAALHSHHMAAGQAFRVVPYRRINVDLLELDWKPCRLLQHSVATIYRALETQAAWNSHTMTEEAHSTVLLIWRLLPCILCMNVLFN